MKKLVNAINDEIKFLKESNIKLSQENLELLENKKILSNMLSKIPTKDLVEELKMRIEVENIRLNKKDVFISIIDEVYKIEKSDILLIVRY